MLAWLVLGCTTEPAVDTPTPPPEPAVTEVPKPKRPWTFEFNNLKLTDDMLMATEPSATTWATVDNKRADIGFMQIYARGDDGFGDMVKSDGSALDDVCNNQDFNALFEAHGEKWLVSHFECTPGGVYLTQLNQDDEGILSPAFNKRVDFSAVGGIWNPCAGVISPWGTHISSEEYEPNARKVPVSEKEDGWDYRAWAGHERYLPEGEKLSPYKYGWTPEITVLDAEGNTRVVKHKAPGRASHEIAYVLPDERTVYLSDDGRAEGFYMFVADRPKDLSSGYLYAARWKQRSEAPVNAEIRWVNLGHADNAYVDGLIDKGVTFDDLFEVAEPTDKYHCPDGFRFTATDYTTECLKLKGPSEKVADPAKAASRLETRRYAAIKAATTEFEKGEGVTYDPRSGTLYLALAKVSGRMLAEEGAPDDHIQLAKNTCGMIVGGKTDKGVVDTSGNLIGSLHVVTEMSQLIAGTPIDKDKRGNTCLEMGIANPDNITYLPGYDLLMIGEDTSKHAVASLWALETRRNIMKRVLVAPPHGEITGIYWTPDLGGHGYLSVAVQHPWRAETLAETKLPEGITEEHQRSLTGVIGPFPKLD